MAITAYTITGTAWTEITGPGESGTCWNRVLPNRGQLAVGHSELGEPASFDESYFMERDTKEILSLAADSSSDIFYAKCVEADDTAQLIVDVS